MASAVGAARNPLFRDLPALFSRPDWASLVRDTDRTEGERTDYVAALLDAFSSVFLAPKAAGEFAEHRSLEQVIRTLPLVANPSGKSSEFLDWLGTWVALSDRLHLPRHKKERLITNALTLYRIRGTRRYLEEMLRYYIGDGATVDEPDLPSIQIGKTSTVGRDMYIGGAPAHFFRVTLLASPAARDEYAHLLFAAKAVIDLSKPAHTWYELRINAPAMQLGKHSTVGVDTLLLDPSLRGKE